MSSGISSAELPTGRPWNLGNSLFRLSSSSEQDPAKTDGAPGSDTGHQHFFHPRNTILGCHQAQGVVIKRLIISMIGSVKQVLRLDDGVHNKIFYAHDVHKDGLPLNGIHPDLLHKLVLFRFIFFLNGLSTSNKYLT